ncbi:hypothetical protein DL96DRAFT_1128072 [Flagelloscypha sp. PMI_526]|nr:hypothetical protein DL96DRAFT_1128072 [Flagelloscypha sp. PMI_526]
MDSSLITSIIGAFQASLSVLVVVFYGVLLSHFHVVSPMGAKEVSKACVRVFLPALLIYDLGNQLHKGNTSNYAIIIAWSLIYNGISLALGSLTTKMLRLPKWVTPAIAFNNSTSLPLLLMDSLSANGLLSLLLKDDQDSSPQALMRARTYFLVNSMVSNCLTFAFGPRLLAEEEVNDTPSASSDPGSSNNEFEQSDIT